MTKKTGSRRYIDESMIGQTVQLDSQDGLDATPHLVEPEMVHAVNAALATGRPLLLRGWPGVGKSQVARAAAHLLERAYLSVAIDARTESQDLLWNHDVVARLAEAQLWGALHPEATQASEVREAIAVQRFVQPRALWWALNWESAQAQLCLSYGVDDPSQLDPAVLPYRPPGWTADRGCVVLLDEMDKADQAVPNGLLDALGHRRFRSPFGTVVRAEGEPPLVIVTTNEERSLPSAFLRRCWVLHLALPPSRDALRRWLTRRGRVHFGPDRITDATLSAAVDALVAVRLACADDAPCVPGQAELLDLLGAICELHPTPEGQHEWVERLRAYVFGKDPDGGSSLGSFGEWSSMSDEEPK